MCILTVKRTELSLLNLVLVDYSKTNPSQPTPSDLTSLQSNPPKPPFYRAQLSPAGLTKPIHHHSTSILTNTTQFQDRVYAHRLTDEENGRATARPRTGVRLARVDTVR